MGLIGRFIDDACERQPALMQCVLARPFGSLRDWISWEQGKECGCLIGTIALCAGEKLPELRLHASKLTDQHGEINGWYTANAVACTAIALYSSAEPMLRVTEDVGVKVSELADRMQERNGYDDTREAYEERVTALIKARIRKALARRQPHGQP